MGCTQSTAKEATGAAAAATPGEHSSGGKEECGGGQVAQGVAVSPSGAGPLKKGNSAVPTRAGEDAGVTPDESAGPDTVGTSYIPPPGGRSGHSMAGGPPTNLAEVPGEPTEDGRLVRPAVTLKSGAVYVGQWKDMQRDGHGKLVWPEGETYEGSFKLNECDGEGVWTDGKGNTFEGQWRKNRINGAGKFTHADGSVYEGQWKDDVKNGEGKETWGDGTVFEGEFVNGDKQGRGKITFPDGSNYEGTFANDVFEGKGVYRWANGRMYEGEWHNGYMHGKGLYTWPKGQFSKYEGSYFVGLKEGPGKLYMRDGRIYVAIFEKNKMEGDVVEISPSGKKRKGIWKNGKNVQWVEGHQNVELVVDDEADEKEAEYQTSAFSNPRQYHQLYEGKKKQRMQIEGGVLHARSGVRTFHAPSPPPNQTGKEGDAAEDAEKAEDDDEAKS
ncbi:MORN repeat-containing protein [Besnoitia besnoiti]|uniref:MORN repeat-containing protein n=1 Tax=Besnoitia besnoiti TaxID=94643 RepID=A0A2A9M8G5_BESBE|nr:MORN repeat-containing protein [Besnoitia besnoiti]PFH34275.1 MORN repeat-containing protein [Besnoitia besnoiti]